MYTGWEVLQNSINLLWDSTCAELSNVANYQTVTVLMSVLTGHFAFCSYTVAAQLITAVFHLDISFIVVPKQSAVYILCTHNPISRTFGFLNFTIMITINHEFPVYMMF